MKAVILFRRVGPHNMTEMPVYALWIDDPDVPGDCVPMSAAEAMDRLRQELQRCFPELATARTPGQSRGPDGP